MWTPAPKAPPDTELCEGDSGLDDDRVKLESVEISGFKSISSDGQAISFGDITILLGANGSGKSNLLSFFKLVNYLTTRGFQTHVAQQGGADTMLYYGARTTEKIELAINLVNGDAKNRYEIKLVHGMPDRLLIAGEKISYQPKGGEDPHVVYPVSDSNESGLQLDKDSTCRFVFNALSHIRAFQFHDTSDTAKIRQNGYRDDTKYLRSDGGNLAAFLGAMKQGQNTYKYYERIVRHIQNVMPQFGDFDLEPGIGNDSYVRLNWREKNSDFLFGPHQISDGSLRFMALSVLLMQPPEYLPSVIVIDEPELGLHPAGILELAGMIRNASQKAQVIVATQSTRLVDEFDADQIVVVERDTENRYSIFKRLDKNVLSVWMERYSLSEIWEKNILGGKP